MVKKKVVKSKKVVKKSEGSSKKLKSGGKKTIGKLHGFSIQFLPYSEIKYLESDERIKKILDIVSENNILILSTK